MVGEFTAKIKLYGSESADLKIIIKSDKKIDEPVKDKKPAVKEVKEVETDSKEEVEEATPQDDVTETEVSESADEA